MKYGIIFIVCILLCILLLSVFIIGMEYTNSMTKAVWNMYYGCQFEKNCYGEDLQVRAGESNGEKMCSCYNITSERFI